jgi:hypothetical protein
VGLVCGTVQKHVEALGLADSVSTGLAERRPVELLQECSHADWVWPVSKRVVDAAKNSVRVVIDDGSKDGRADHERNCRECPDGLSA